jgi:hypothetical protein
MTTPIAHRSIAVLKYPKQVPALVTFAQAIVTAMTGNTNFPKPTPMLPDVTQAIADLAAAQTAAQARTHGAVVTRNQKKIALVAKLELLKAYIQNVADADREQASGIIESASLSVRKVPVRAKRTFAAKLGAVSGTVLVSTPSAGHRASYDWQYSADAGKTWLTLPTTLQAKTSLKALVPGSTYSFRYRAVTKGGVGDWSEPVAILVK